MAGVTRVVSEYSLSYAGAVSKRAKPLPPDERRAALVTATLGLISDHGPAVSTKQIAAAAGVAEGTIFGVFPDKQSLVHAAVEAAFDPEPVVQRLKALTPDQCLERRLVAAVEILQERLQKVHHLVMAFRLFEAPEERAKVHPPSNAAIIDALADVIRPDADRLRKTPEECARLLRIAVFAGSHPRITDDNPLSAKEIVDLLLHGIAQVDAAPAPTANVSGEPAC